MTLYKSSAIVPASNLDDSPTALAALQAKADQTQPRDRCLLYAELIKRMTELAGQQFNAGDSVHAVQTLKLVQRYAEKIHADVADVPAALWKAISALPICIRSFAAALSCAAARTRGTAVSGTAHGALDLIIRDAAGLQK